MTSEAAQQDFSGRVAIVTGAARGLGRATAARLHERGASVAVNVRDRARAEAVASASSASARSPSTGDVAAPGVPEELVRRTLERFGRVDILVNNAALPLTTRFAQITAEEWRAGARGEPDGAVPPHAGGAAGDEGAALRPHHQHLVVGRAAW